MGAPSGVVLDSGEEIKRRIVVSNLDVRRTFLETMDPEDLPGEFVEQVRNFKIRGSSGKLNIALDGLPRLPGNSARARPCIRGDLHVTDSIEMLERAYDDWKEGRWSRAPYVDMLIPIANRSDHGARRQALHVGVRAVLSRTVWPTAKWDAAGAPGVRRHGDRSHRRAQPGFQRPDPACRDPHAPGISRTRSA